jgi:CRISPR-associated protein Cas1
MQDLHELPKLRDSLSYVYVEHAIVDRDQHAIELVSKTGRTLVPAAALCVLMLGPGTSVTHAAVKLLAEHGCTAVWCGEDGMRMYAQGSGETRRARHLLRQAEFHCDKEKHTQVVLGMYRKRFDVDLDPMLSLPQIRGMEGRRVRSVYELAGKEYGVPWQGRIYDPHEWGKADPINRALSAANALLNGICHAAIVSGGYSPGLGFVHTGRYLSFVYDIADLYKTEITIPIAFQTVSESDIQVDKRVRQACRQKFYETKLLERILPDIDELLEIHPGEAGEEGDMDGEAMLAAPIWEELLDEPGQMAWS